MARFHGFIGFAESKMTAPGVHKDLIVEYPYYGEVVRNTRRLQGAEKVNYDLSVGNSISIVSDAYAREHFFAMRYVKWSGALWTIDDVEVQSPRLLLRLGGVYNGPTVSTPGQTGGVTR